VSSRAPGANAPERALAAARWFLRQQTITNQSGQIPLTPRTYRVGQVSRLSPAAGGSRMVRNYFTTVKQRCGEVQAERTWLVVVDVVAAQLPLSPMTVLTSPTSRGWRVTLRGGGRPLTN
jgi:hypothetical protein